VNEGHRVDPDVPGEIAMIVGTGPERRFCCRFRRGAARHVRGLRGFSCHDGSTEGREAFHKNPVRRPAHRIRTAVDVSFSVPEDLAQRLEKQWGDLPRRALEAVVVDAYREETITLGEGRRVLGHATGLETEAFLKDRGALFDCSEEELEADVQAAKNARR